MTWTHLKIVHPSAYVQGVNFTNFVDDEFPTFVDDGAPIFASDASTGFTKP